MARSIEICNTYKVVFFNCNNAKTNKKKALGFCPVPFYCITNCDYSLFLLKSLLQLFVHFLVIAVVCLLGFC